MADQNMPQSYDSHYNGDGALKNAHDENTKSIRTTNSGLPFGATRFSAEVDSNGNYTKITYYADLVREETKVVFNADVSSSLNSTYWVIYSARDATKYYIWYSVDGNGVNPNLSGATGIKVDLTENDPALVVALATRNALSTTNAPFTVDLKGTGMLLVANGKGECTDATAETSGFNVTTMIQGTTELRAIVEMEYDANCNIIGYTQDVFDGSVV